MHYFKLALLLVFFLLLSCISVQPAEDPIVIPHPDGPLYAGDQVSFEILLPAATSDKTDSVVVTFNGQELGRTGLGSYGIGGRRQATLWWVWDTHNLKPGSYTLIFTRLPENITWHENFILHPADQVPASEPDAHWASNTSTCCNLYYITGTAAERDITTLSQEADEQSASVSTQMGSSLSERVDIILMSRVVGQGGFTWSGIYISYLDDNYLGSNLPILFHHEFVHYYDGALGGTYLPSMLQEGLAVYLTGGHFKRESLGLRAAALLDLGWYIPLSTIADDFYNQQHDISYLEAGALVQYLVETYGWGAFNEFYRTIPAPENQTNSAVMDNALQDHFGVSFAGLETAYIAYLKSQPISQTERIDLQTTVNFFDTVRRYQEAYDPSAYFQTAWLPDGSVMRQRGIVVDFLRHPEGWDNQLFESLLIRSNRKLFSGNYNSARSTLKWTNWIMTTVKP
jgi:hypothetical protein